MKSKKKLNKKDKVIYSFVIPLAPGRKAEIVKCIKNLNFDKNTYEIIIEEGTNCPRNRNNGIEKAKGKWIIFLDDDGYIRDDFLLMLNYILHKNPNIDVLGGPQLTPPTDSFFAKESGKALANPICMPNVNKRYKMTAETLEADSNYLSGANLIARASLFKDNDLLFDECIYPSDDVTFVEKAKAKGKVIASSPMIPIYHKRRPDTSSLFKQVAGYGRAKVEHGSKKGLMFMIPALFVLYLFTMVILDLSLLIVNLISPVTESTLFLVSLFHLPLLLYFVLGVILGIVEGSILFPYIMFVIHTGYGKGILSYYAEEVLAWMAMVFLIFILIILSIGGKKMWEDSYDSDYGYN